MGLNKQTGNMYPFVSHTLNIIKGQCPHECSYCYMRRFPQPELHFAEQELQTKLGHHNFIFVGSSTDMWAKPIPKEWIAKVLKHCRDYDAYNRYLFQSKNPARFLEWLGFYPDDIVLGTTIESNLDWGKSKAPLPWERYRAMINLKATGVPLMVSIEPIMDFAPTILVDWVREIAPEFVSIGADSKGHKLPEPNPEKIKKLIEVLRDITKVYIKDNLNRLLRQEMSE